MAALIAVVIAVPVFGRSWLSTLARWTEETFRFDTGIRQLEMPLTDAFHLVLLSVEEETDIPAVPCRAPQGTEMIDGVTVTDRPDNCRIRATFAVKDREFILQYIIHKDALEEVTGTYQRDDEVRTTYEVGGIPHYITENLGNLSVFWINGTVEGHIQGDLTMAELQAMLDSIYEG